MPLIEVVLINWRRPDNIRKIVHALKEQTVPCTITICDCHIEHQFALGEDIVALADRIYAWTHNLGAYSRYTPLASYDHLFTFFIDDDLLPGKKCLETFLKAASEKPDFGVLGQLGRIIGADHVYKPLSIALSDRFIEVDFIVRAYFVKTRNLFQVPRFRWEIGYFDDPLPEDDLLLCAALRHYDGLSCYMIPFDGDVETQVDKEELSDEHALSDRDKHYFKRTEFIERLMYYGWQPVRQPASQVTLNNQLPRFSVCIVARNKAAYISYALEQVYDWDCCHEIIVVEEAVAPYRGTAGLPGGETMLVTDFPDPDHKIRYVSGTFSDRAEQRNEYAKRITGDYALILEADEFYTKESLRKLQQDVIENPCIDVFMFDFSHDVEKRTYYHLWKDLKRHVIGGYWDLPHNRIYKWEPGTAYRGADHNHPTRSDGVKLHPSSMSTRCAYTRAICVHAGFAKDAVNRNDKNEYSIAWGESEPQDRYRSEMRQLYIDCRIASEQWFEGMPLPHNAALFPFTLALPESLLRHPKYETG